MLLPPGRVFFCLRKNGRGLFFGIDCNQVLFYNEVKMRMIFICDIRKEENRMELFEAIRTRRSIGKVKPDPVPRECIEKMLEAATWAPNHHRTEPWRFLVLTGEGRKRLGHVMMAVVLEKKEDLSSAEREERLQRELNRAFRAPVVIVVIASPANRPNVLKEEELAACHAAVQNMLLAAHAQGLGAIWRTGKAAYHPAAKQGFELTDQEQIVGYIYVGYPDLDPPAAKRIPYAEKTTWIV
jgi:nitroreductase